MLIYILRLVVKITANYEKVMESLYFHSFSHALVRKGKF